jgi:NAD+ synthase (glutamine-hydrolysing)
MSHHHGFVRVAAAVPPLALAEPAANADRCLELLTQAGKSETAVAVFPELALSGYTCHDLFHQPTLLTSAVAALEDLVGRAAKVFSGLGVVGLPLLVGDAVFNCAAVFQNGRVLGIVPKSYLANHKEYYDARYFAPAAHAAADSVTLPSGAIVPFGTDLLFEARGVPGFVVGIEICEDLWVPVPPSCRQALAGATILLNLSASNELIGKAAYRRQLVIGQSGRCMAAYVYCSSGVHESTQDIVFGGHCLIAENGALLAESDRFRRDGFVLAADVDIDRVRADRWSTMSFGQSVHVACNERPFRRVPFEAELNAPAKLLRTVDAHPFVPSANAELNDRCAEIFNIQTAGLARRLEHIGKPPVAIGVSGGLDSTLALMVASKTFDLLSVPRGKILGFSLPGFGTTSRTRSNANALMQQLGVAAKEIDIRALCLAEWKALGHAPFGIALEGLDADGLTAKLRDVTAEKRHDLVFENVQARVRTNLLMNAGFVVGTGDLSELALGWCTYNADHMSMYGVNNGVPKTLVKFLVRWAAEHEFTGPVCQTLRDIVATVISPELLPADANGAAQGTEATVGPYELHDFFLFHMLRYGAPPAKLRYLARLAEFDKRYSDGDIDRWLQVFLSRFFANQFKRSCLPDGPKVGSISLSPRGDWRMPPDAKPSAWS